MPAIDTVLAAPEDSEAEVLRLYRAHLSKGRATLAELIGPTLEKKVRENAEMMLAALKAEAEASTRARRVVR